jgi:hypothetical protein
MKSENNELKEIDETSRELSKLKEEIKPKKEKTLNQKEKEKNKSNKSNKSNLLFKNDINIIKPKYYGRTKSLLFIGQTPIFILGESSKKLLL